MSRRLLTLVIFAALAAGAFISTGGWSASAEGPAESAAEPAQQRRTRPRQTRRRTQRRPAPRAGVDYSSFSHSTQAHRERSCQSCHTIPTPNWTRVRSREEAFPDVTDYPGHDSCLDCHRRQFFSGARPVICSVCHTNVSPRDGTRFAFRNPEEAWLRSPKARSKGEPDFITRFPHDRHQDVMAQFDAPGVIEGFGFVRASFSTRRQETAAEPVNSCTICHKIHEPKGKTDEDYVKKPADEPKKDNLGREEPYWFKRGTMMTSPTSHASCFSCHWQDGGEKPLSNDCAGCHTLATAGIKLQLQLEGADAEPDHPSVVRVINERMIKQWNQRRSARFTHELKSHQQGCTTCHVGVTGAARVNADTLFVPIQTCGKCHGTKTGSNKSRTVLANEVRAKQKDDSFQCIKCHINLSGVPFKEVPRSHTAMVE